MLLSDEEVKRKRRKESRKKYEQTESYKALRKKYQQSEKGKKTRKTWTQKASKTEKWQESRRKVLRKYSKSKKFKKTLKKFKQSEKGKVGTRKYNLSEKGLEAKKRYQQTEKGKAVRTKIVRNWNQSDKGKAYVKKYQQSDKGKEAIRKYQQENHEYLLGYQRKYRKRHPIAQTKEMTKYRRNHSECEWSYCEQVESLHVHHILARHKHPQYVDGDYHGRLGNNFICFCPFHHFAYHSTYSTTRNDKKHKSALTVLWYHVEQWADNNKISIEDVEIELAQMLPVKVILA